MNEQKMREEFEVFMRQEYPQYGLELRPDMLYFHGFTREALPIWQSACASKQKEIDKLNAQVAEYDGLMEDAQTFQQQILELSAQVDVMRDLIWRADGELRVLGSEYADLINDLSAALTSTPSEALAQLNRELPKE